MIAIATPSSEGGFTQHQARGLGLIQCCFIVQGPQEMGTTVVPV